MPVTIASTTVVPALDAITNRVVLAAASGAVRGWILVVDGECMLVQGVVPGASASTFQVLRGWDGTAATPHAAGAAVLVGPRSHFSNAFNRSGAYIAAQEVAVPSVNVPAGNHFVDSSGTWDQTKLGGSTL